MRIKNVGHSEFREVEAMLMNRRYEVAFLQTDCVECRSPRHLCRGQSVLCVFVYLKQPTIKRFTNLICFLAGIILRLRHADASFEERKWRDSPRSANQRRRNKCLWKIHDLDSGEWQEECGSLCLHPVYCVPVEGSASSLDSKCS